MVSKIQCIEESVAITSRASKVLEHMHSAQRRLARMVGKAEAAGL